MRPAYCLPCQFFLWLRRGRPCKRLMFERYHPSRDSLQNAIGQVRPRETRLPAKSVSLVQELVWALGSPRHIMLNFRVLWIIVDYY